MDNRAHYTRPAAVLLLFLMLSCLFSSFTPAAQAQSEVQFWQEQQLYESSGPASSALEATVAPEELRSYLFTALWDCPEIVDLSSFRFAATKSNADTIARFIWREMPEAFHVNGIGFTVRNRYLNGLSATYHYSEETYHSMYAECEAAAEKMISDLQGSALGDVEKALLLHDRIALTCAYDTVRLNSGALIQEDYNIYGTLVNHTSVCQGYALTYIYLLEKVGIDSYLCSSDSLNHAWNIVYINGVPYHVDVTFDDPTEDITGRVNHNNFLRSSAGIYESNHNATDYDTTPTNTTYDQWFWQNSATAFQLVNGALYYIDNKAATLNRYADQTVVKEIDDVWRAGASSYYPGSFARLSSDGTNLLYSLSDAIYRLNPAIGAAETVYQPDLSIGSYFSVYGFTLRDGYLICDRNNSPNFTQSTKDQYQLRVPYTVPDPGKVWGDVNGNQRADVTDALLLLQYLVGVDIGEIDTNSLDVNDDGVVSITDALLLLQYLVGLYIPE